MTNVDASWALGDIEQGASILHETPLLAIQVLFSFLFFSIDPGDTGSLFFSFLFFSIDPGDTGTVPQKR